jgi:hypothetical protein
MKTQVLSEQGQRTEEPLNSWLTATALARPVKEVGTLLKEILTWVQ